MRSALILSFVANLVLVAVQMDTLPERVAIHFGPGGWADGWGHKLVHGALSLGMHVAFFCMFYFAPRWVLAVPPRWVNIPNRMYWLAEPNRTLTAEKLQRLMWPFGTAFFVFFFAVGVLTLQAHRVDPPRLDERAFLGALALFLAYTVTWLIAWLKEFRLPKGPHEPRVGPR